jgi:hypothetical protein
MWMESRNIKSTDNGTNDLIDANFRPPVQGGLAIDSPVIYGVRAETSNPYYLGCIERDFHIQLHFFQIIEYQPTA